MYVLSLYALEFILILCCVFLRKKKPYDWVVFRVLYFYSYLVHIITLIGAIICHYTKNLTIHVYIVFDVFVLIF